MLNYVRQGAGDALVLIHGFLGSKDVFQDALEELAEHYDVIAVDLPGHGQSQVEQGSYTVYDYANEVAAVLEHEYITEATWLGHSLGGYIVLAAVEQNIAPINKAILAYSSDLPDTDEQKEKRTKQQHDIRENGVKEYVDQLIEGFFSDNPKADKVEIGRHIAYQCSEEGLVLALDAMKSRPNQQNLTKTTNTPILLIEGTQDKVVKPIETSNPHIQKVQTNTGHLGMIEEPGEFAKAIVEFIS